MKFGYILGATGTLKSLSEKQLKIIQEKYAIETHTYMPPLFDQDYERTLSASEDEIQLQPDKPDQPMRTVTPL